MEKVMCKSWAYPNSQFFLPIWSGLEETTNTVEVEGVGKKVVFFSILYGALPSWPQIWFSPEEAVYKGRQRYDVFTSLP